MTQLEIVMLLFAVLIVGFITQAGGATTISLSVLMFMGLPLNVANESVSYRYGFGWRAIVSRAHYFLRL